MTPVLVILAMLAAMGVIGAYVIVTRARQIQRLAELGVPVEGVVERRFQTGKAGKAERTKRIAYTYRGPDGREYRRAISLTRGQWEQYTEGGPIRLICLPDEPGVSAEESLVLAAREALARKTARQ